MAHQIDPSDGRFVMVYGIFPQKSLNDMNAIIRMNNLLRILGNKISVNTTNPLQIQEMIAII
jgi:hypothetical protein